MRSSLAGRLSRVCSTHHQISSRASAVASSGSSSRSCCYDAELSSSIIIRRKPGSRIRRSFTVPRPPTFQCQQVRYFSTEPAAVLVVDGEEEEEEESQEQIIAKAQVLLDETVHPKGSLFTSSLGDEAKGVLDFFKKTKPTDAESVNLAIELVERLVAERALTKNNKQVSDENTNNNNNKWCEWIWDEPQRFTQLLVLWKEAAAQGQPVVSARELVQKLQTMARTLPEFRYDAAAIKIIIETVVKQTSTEEAPFLAEKLLALRRKLGAETQCMELLPDTLNYNLVFQAWALSGLPEAPDRMNELLQSMREEGAAPNKVTYNIMLRYYGRHSGVDKIQEIQETMKKEGLFVGRGSLAQSIFGYAQVGMTRKAEEILEEMLAIRPVHERENFLIGECVQNILLAYRRKLCEAVNFEQKEVAVKYAEALFNKIHGSTEMDDEEHARIRHTMMDIYVCAGKHTRLQALLDHIHLDRFQLSILIKSLGKANMADRATAILKQALSDKEVDVDIEVFSALVNAWAESSRPDAVQQAFEVFELMNSSPICKQLGLKPNTVMFGALLKCLSQSNNKNAGATVVEILDEMERRCRAGEGNPKPNRICYTVAMKTCLGVRDAATFEIVMRRMESSDSPPGIRTYTDILNHWSKVGTPEAAERTEKILLHVKRLAVNDTSLRPDAFMYTIAMNAWTKTGDPGASERMWRIFELMQEDQVDPTFVTFTTLITFFSRSRDYQTIERADLLLQAMEQSQRKDTQPDYRQFVPVIRAWRDAGDMDRATRVLMRFVHSPGSNPNPSTLEMVLKGWITVGDLDRATEFLNYIQELVDQNVLQNGPPTRTYRSLIGAWKHSSHPDKIDNMKKLTAAYNLHMMGKQQESYNNNNSMR